LQIAAGNEGEDFHKYPPGWNGALRTKQSDA
jgi:hypothetical protein